MNCSRCKKAFDPSELRRPSFFLQILAAPVLILFMLNSTQVGDEALARYCRPCRRQMNVVFFFIAFMVVTFGTIYALKKLGN